jgi:N-acetylmuramoyl-L-alanine amidase
METPAPDPDFEPTLAPEPLPVSRPSFSTFRALQTVIGVAILVATLFTLWTPANLFSGNVSQKMSLALLADQTQQPVDAAPTANPNPHIGIVSGHWGNDSGAVCSDGLTEADINLKIATLVKQDLVNAGYSVDLLQEFDAHLKGYQGLVLVSIHNDSCEYINDEATGFKVAAALSSTVPEKAQKLTACMIDRYQKATGLQFHYNSITPDMTSYHAFNEINPLTPAAIIETGFLNLDRQVLTQHTDKVAKGVSDGILCFIRNEDVAPTPTASSRP